MGLRNNKRGIFFMMLAIVIISLFVISITFFSGYSLRKSVQNRVESLSEFVNGVEKDLPRQLFILGYRSIFLMEKEIVDNGNYLEDSADYNLQTAFFNKTIEGKEQSLLTGTTFSDLQTAIQDRAGEISANVILSNPSINLTQEDPWNLKITFTTDFYVADENNLASWNKTLVSVSYISITNFTDPVYSLNTNGLVNPQIIQTPFQTFDASAINSHIANGYYRDRNNSPSFIDRLEGNILVPSHPEYGIESLVDVTDIPDDYLQPADRTDVDYLYFESTTTGTAVSGVSYSWFRLDTGHRSDYGV